MATDEQCNCLPVNGMPSREAHSQTCPRWHELNCTEDKCHCPTKPAPSLVDAEWRCELCGAPDQAVDRIFKLRAALREILDHVNSLDDASSTSPEVREIAEQSLAGESEGQDG